MRPMSKSRFLEIEASEEPTDNTITQTTRRHVFSTSFRLNLFLKRKGTCASCYLKIDAGKAWDNDHILPLALGGNLRSQEPSNPLQALPPIKDFPIRHPAHRQDQTSQGGRMKYQEFFNLSQDSLVQTTLTRSLTDKVLSANFKLATLINVSTLSGLPVLRSVMINLP